MLVISLWLVLGQAPKFTKVSCLKNLLKRRPLKCNPRFSKRARGFSSPSGPNSSVFSRTETSGYSEPLVVISDAALIYKTFLQKRFQPCLKGESVTILFLFKWT